MANTKKYNKRYAKIRPNGLNWMTVPLLDVHYYINESVTGDKWEIELLDMTDEEYNNLPESDGF